MPYREVVCHRCAGSGKSVLLDSSGNRELLCSVCKGEGKCREWFEFEPKEDKAKLAKFINFISKEKEDSISVTLQKLARYWKISRKWIATDADYESFLKLLHKDDLGLSDLTAMVASSLNLGEQQAVVIAKALLASATDVDATIAMKKMLVGTYCNDDKFKNKFKMSGGYSSSSVEEFQFSVDFSYCYRRSYFSGYVSPSFLPVQMSYSSPPDETEKRGHYLLGRNDRQRSEMDVVVRLLDDSLPQFHVKLAGREAYIGGEKMKRTY